ncbi:MAG: hypothetical protein ABF289_12365 [Clostridiales bacterium]
MGLSLSNNQIAKEFDLCQSDTQYMTTKLREGIAIKRPKVKLEGEVVYNSKVCGNGLFDLLLGLFIS